jgi:hypothetical protein
MTAILLLWLGCVGSLVVGSLGAFFVSRSMSSICVVKKVDLVKENFGDKFMIRDCCFPLQFLVYFAK